MYEGEVREIPDLSAFQLIKAGYVVEVVKPKPVKKRKEKKNG